jgi:hypothetical protein
MAVKVKIIVFWDVMPCSFVESTNILEEPTAFMFGVEEYASDYSGHHFTLAQL